MSKKVFYPKGSVIFSEGDFQLNMYDISTGRVGIYHQYGKPTETKLVELGEDVLFGEMGLIDSKPRSQTAVALEDTYVTVVDHDNFEEFFNNSPEKVVLVLQNVSKRVRELSNDYVELVRDIHEFVALQESKNPKKESLWSKIKKALSKEKKDEYFVDNNKKANEFAAVENIKEVFEKGSIIFAEGADENWMYDLKWGSVGIYSDFGKDTQKLLTTVTEGSYFGEMGMIDSLPRSATAVALEDSKVVVITLNNFNKYLKERPNKIADILQYLSERLRKLTTQFNDIQKTVEYYQHIVDGGEQPSEALMNKLKSFK